MAELVSAMQPSPTCGTGAGSVGVVGASVSYECAIVSGVRALEMHTICCASSL